MAFYSDRGYPKARITGVDVNLRKTKDAVDLAIRIDEGLPVVVDAVDLKGFDDLPAPIRRELDNLPLKAGQPRDRENVRASRDLGARLLRDNGYPHAVVQVHEEPRGDASHVSLSFQADPGPKSYFGEIGIEGLETVSEHIVRRELTFRPGELYRESRVTTSQQRLIELGLFQFAHITPASDDPRATQ